MKEYSEQKRWQSDQAVQGEEATADVGGQTPSVAARAFDMEGSMWWSSCTKTQPAREISGFA